MTIPQTRAARPASVQAGTLSTVTPCHLQFREHTFRSDILRTSPATAPPQRQHREVSTPPSLPTPTTRTSPPEPPELSSCVPPCSSRDFARSQHEPFAPPRARLLNRPRLPRARYASYPSKRRRRLWVAPVRPPDRRYLYAYVGAQETFVVLSKRRPSLDIEPSSVLLPPPIPSSSNPRSHPPPPWHSAARRPLECHVLAPIEAPEPMSQPSREASVSCRDFERFFGLRLPT